MLRHASTALGALPFFALGFDSGEEGACLPRRKGFMRPQTTDTFILPLRQSFIKDARLMPGTTRLLCLLAGWAGKGQPIETSLSVLARHLQRSPRQIQRYIKDAVEEGYLSASRIANRLGYIIGLRLRLNRAAIYAPSKAKAEPQVGGGRAQPRASGRGVINQPLSRRKPATTYPATTNEKHILNNRIDPTFESRLREICASNGIDYPE